MAVGCEYECPDLGFMVAPNDAMNGYRQMQQTAGNTSADQNA